MNSNLRSKLLGAAVAAAAIFSFPGCVIYSNGGGGGGGNLYPGDVTFTWHLAGGTCGDFPNVASVHVVIPGETLQNDGVYPCLVPDTRGTPVPGIVVNDFAGGTYSFTMDALDYRGERLFSASGNFTVNGNIAVDVNMLPVGGGSAYAYLSWTFPPNSSTAGAPANCAQAGVATVDVYYDGDQANPQSIPCADGEAASAHQSPSRFVGAGTHTLQLVGVDSKGYPLYQTTQSVNFVANNPNSDQFTMQWAVGGAAIAWTLTDGSVTQTCGSSGVTDMQINFKDSTGAFIYGQSGDPQKCTASPIVYSFLQPGTYQVFIAGHGAGVNYYSNYTAPPTIVVQPGVFPGAGQALNVTIYRQ